MKKSILLLWGGMLLLGGCGRSRWEIPGQQVQQVLAEYSRQHPENQVIIHTRFGDMTLRLYAETPLHRANFLRLVRQGYYREREFYRLVKNVCIQGGGNQQDQLGYTVPAEHSPQLIHRHGAIAMARYSENNPEKRSSATEFFIVTKGRYYNAEELARLPETTRRLYLQHGGEMIFQNEYTVFGEVVQGLDIADRIAKMPLTDFETPSEKVKFSIEVK